MSESMYQFFTDDDNLELIEDLRSVGMKMESEIKNLYHKRIKLTVGLNSLLQALYQSQGIISRVRSNCLEELFQEA